MNFQNLDFSKVDQGILDDSELYQYLTPEYPTDIVLRDFEESVDNRLRELDENPEIN